MRFNAGAAQSQLWGRRPETWPYEGAAKRRPPQVRKFAELQPASPQIAKRLQLIQRRGRTVREGGAARATGCFLPLSKLSFRRVRRTRRQPFQTDQQVPSGVATLRGQSCQLVSRDGRLQGCARVHGRMGEGARDLTESSMTQPRRMGGLQFGRHELPCANRYGPYLPCDHQYPELQTGDLPAEFPRDPHTATCGIRGNGRG